MDHFPKATENMDQIIEFTSDLIEKGFAYESSDGDVYFDVTKVSDYGKLSGRTLDIDAGRRGRHGRPQTVQRRLRPLEKRQTGRALLGEVPGDPADPAGTSSAP